MSNELSEKYGDFFLEGQRLRVLAGESAEMHLQAQKIPEELLSLMPYAEFWGISDDGYRIDLIKQSPQEIWHDFQEAVSKKKTPLLQWLAGPEADNELTPEYLAFSFMLQAFDWPRA